MREATSEGDHTADVEWEVEDGAQPFENRGARRSKGKATANRTGATGSRVQGRSGTVQGPRQYGNRRSG